MVRAKKKDDNDSGWRCHCRALGRITLVAPCLVTLYRKDGSSSTDRSWKGVKHGRGK